MPSPSTLHSAVDVGGTIAADTTLADLTIRVNSAVGLVDGSGCTYVPSSAQYGGGGGPTK